MKFSVCPSNGAKKIETDSGNSGLKVEQLFKVYLCLEDIFVCHKAEIYCLLSLSSITCRNEYLALLTKRSRLYFSGYLMHVLSFKISFKIRRKKRDKKITEARRSAYW